MRPVGPEVALALEPLDDARADRHADGGAGVGARDQARPRVVGVRKSTALPCSVLPAVTTSTHSSSSKVRNAKSSPVRAKVCTSSTQTAMPASRQRCISAAKNSRGAVWKPPSPCTSSKSIAAMRPGKRARCASSAATLLRVESGSSGS